jgi:LysM repeat protein
MNPRTIALAVALTVAAAVTITPVMAGATVGEHPAPVTVTHIVQAGDTLSAIVDRYGADLDRVVAINGIADPARIDIGDRITVPLPPPDWDTRYPPGIGWYAAHLIDGPIRDIADHHGIDWRLLAALIWTESGFNINARSPVGAIGLTQLMPGTAADMGVDPHHPAENLHGGARYLAAMLDRHDGDIALALASYNAGPGAVARWGGVPPYPETQAYVVKVTARWALFVRSGQ